MSIIEQHFSETTLKQDIALEQ